MSCRHRRFPVQIGFQVFPVSLLNTLLVNGRGQLGEGAEWFRSGDALAQKSRPKMLRADSTPAMDQITGDAGDAYPRNLGLRRFVRHIIFVKPDVLIVADDILLDKEASLELRLQPEQEAVRHGNVFLTRDKRATLRLEPLATEMQIIGARGADVAGARYVGSRVFPAHGARFRSPTRQGVHLLRQGPVVGRHAGRQDRSLAHVPLARPADPGQRDRRSILDERNDRVSADGGIGLVIHSRASGRITETWLRWQGFRFEWLGQHEFLVPP